MKTSEPIVVVSSFTSDPVRPPLEYWVDRLGFESPVAIGPYDQIVQHLLDSESVVRQNSNGFNVVLLRIEDLVRNPSGDLGCLLSEQIEILVHALETASSASEAEFITVICPPSTVAKKRLGTLLNEKESFLSDVLVSKKMLQVRPAQIEELYPVATREDVYRSELAHIPYTEEFFAALGTMIARRIFALTVAPRKAIVMDCDNVLWKGVCGEEGAEALEIDEAALIMQRFALKQRSEGVLLCLSSKNVEADVSRVFDTRPEMLLRKEHLAAWRINWNSKCFNVRSLAEEMNFGLDTLIFLDDDSVECSAMRSGCPEVLTIQVPGDAKALDRTLQHIWLLDKMTITREDAERTQYYLGERNRKNLESSVISIEQFIQALELRVDVHPVAEEEVARISQLTARVNQFRTAGARCSVAEINNYRHTRGQECLSIGASDRFGDYGIIGAAFIATTIDCFVVDSFLLSCRALGRGVEEQSLKYIRTCAQERGFREILFRFTPSPRNEPARRFLGRISDSDSTPGLFRCKVAQPCLPQDDEESTFETTSQ
jgi:FkbH-like protein